MRSGLHQSISEYQTMLDAGDAAVVTHAEFHKAKLPQERLRLFHLLEPLFVHFQPVGHA